MAAGILLGPSLLGWLAPGLSGLLFPPDAVPPLTQVAQAAVVLYMFLVGAELDFDHARAQVRSIAGDRRCRRRRARGRSVRCSRSSSIEG